MDKPIRKQNRIPEYDYNQSGAYFVTVCVKNRKPILSQIVGDDAHIVPKPYGIVVEKYIKNVPEIEKYVIMPDHIHMIIRIDNDEYGTMSYPQNNQVSSIVRSLKILTTKEIGQSIFQRSYFDHVIRNQEDYNGVWEYIDKNPLNWMISKQP